MELWDAYDVRGNSLEHTLIRGEEVPADEYHLVADILVRHTDGSFLLTQRDPQKPAFPGCWELSAGGSVLAVSPFTLCANTRHGRRPDFLEAARPEKALPLFEELVDQLRKAGIADVQTGRFGADMQVSLVNDGPVTVTLDTDVGG